MAEKYLNQKQWRFIMSLKINYFWQLTKDLRCQKK